LTRRWRRRTPRARRAAVAGAHPGGVTWGLPPAGSTMRRPTSGPRPRCSPAFVRRPRVARHRDRTRRPLSDDRIAARASWTPLAPANSPTGRASRRGGPETASMRLTVAVVMLRESTAIVRRCLSHGYGNGQAQWELFRGPPRPAAVPLDLFAGARGVRWPSWRCGLGRGAAASRPCAGEHRAANTKGRTPAGVDVAAASCCPGGRSPSRSPARVGARHPPPVSRACTRAHVASSAPCSEDGRPGRLEHLRSATTVGARLRSRSDGTGAARHGCPGWLARELIASSGGAAPPPAGPTAGSRPRCGTGIDHLAANGPPGPKIIDAYTARWKYVQSAGAGVILMASRALRRGRPRPRDSWNVYRRVLKQASSRSPAWSARRSTRRCALLGRVGSRRPRRPCSS